MMIKSKLLWKVIGLEILVIFWFVVNGAYVSMTHPTTHYLQFLGIFPLAIGIAFYLTKTKKWPQFFSFQQNMSFKNENPVSFSASFVFAYYPHWQQRCTGKFHC